MAKLGGAGAFSKMGEEEAGKIARSARATAAANMMAKEKGSVRGAIADIAPIVGAIGGGIIGGMGGDPVTGAKMGYGAGQGLGEAIRPEEKGAAILEQVQAEEAMAQGMSPVQTKMSNMAKADKKSAGDKAAGAGIDIMSLLSKLGDSGTLGGM